jgi:hypothetical protein
MNLAGSTPGSTYTAVMTCSTVSPIAGTVYKVEWGNGVGTNLFLGNGTVGIGTSTTAHSSMTSEATVVRAVVFGDEAGRVTIAADRKVVLGSDFTNATATPANVTGLVLTLPVGTWAVFYAGEHTISNTDCGVLITAVGSSATVLGGTFNGSVSNSEASSNNIGRAGMILATVASGTGTVQVQLACEVGSRTAVIKAGASICAIRIA